MGSDTPSTTHIAMHPGNPYRILEKVSNRLSWSFSRLDMRNTRLARLVAEMIGIQLQPGKIST